MNTPDSQQIVARFFEALRRLKQDRRIRGKQTFTARHGINRWNMNSLEKDLSRDIFQPAWLEYLVRDHNVSPRWLLTGEGPFYDTPPEPSSPPAPSSPSPTPTSSSPPAPSGGSQLLP